MIPTLSKFSLLQFGIFSICMLLVFSCSKSHTTDEMPCGANPKSFAVDVNPLIQTYCNQAGCHNSGSTNGPGALTNYSQVFNAKSNIRTQIQAGLMPQNATLNQEQRNAIICWIDSGAPNN